MNPIRFSALLFLLAPWLCPPLAAQARDTVHEIEGVVVSGRRVGAAGGASEVAVHPDSLLLRPAATVEDALRELPFVHVRQNSRGMAEISVRGSESRQVAVLLDGVPLSLAWDHRTDPSVIPLLGVRRLSLVRGLPSMLGGPNVLGGVVEVDVGRGAGRDESAVRAMAGWDDAGYRAAGASAAGAAGRFTGRAGAGFRSRDGLALPGEVDDPAGRGGLRANSDVEEANAFGAARWEGTGRSWISLSGMGFRAERGVPPELHLAEPRLWRIPEEWQGVAALTAGSGRRRTAWGAGDVEASLGYNAGRQEIESFASSAYREVVNRETGDGRTRTLRALGRHTLGEGGELRGAATYAAVSHLEALDSVRSAYRQRLWSVGSEAEWRFPGATRVTVGAALDGADTPRTGGKPALGALSAWGGRVGASTLALRPELQLHASVSSRARFPALRELYSGALGRFEPNPGLRPERLNAAEAGATWKRAGAEAQATFFAHRLSDAVARISTPDRKFRRVNRDELKSAGVELLLGGSVGGVQLLGDLMLQHVSREPLRPEHMPVIRAGLDVDAPLPLNLRARAGIQHTGSQFCVHPELGSDVRLPAATRVDLGVRRTWRRLRATLALDNAADAAAFDQCGMPQPGRTFRVGLELL
jgi:iron complex outermembrane receptor protein